MTSRLLPAIRASPISRRTLRPAASSIRHYSKPSSTPATRPCPKCSTPLPLSTPLCPKCSTLLRLPSQISHHSILALTHPIPSPAAFSQPFDIPLELSQLPSHGYDLDPRELRGRMLKLQKELHPDKYSGTGGEVDLARELSGRVNEAYGTLMDPLKRAEYILSVHSQATEESDSLSDPTLLAEILEAREELDSATTESEVNTIRQTNHEKVQATIAAIKEAFSQNPPNLVDAKSLAVQLKYWQGLEDAAKAWTAPG